MVCSLKSQGTNASMSSTKITNPIIIPKGRYCATPLLKPTKLILSIITTNKNKTASAPTYTIIRSNAKNSAPTRIKKPATEKNVTISHSTECTGLFAKITNKDDKIAVKAKK